jgi:hypothetical protein
MPPCMLVEEPRRGVSRPAVISRATLQTRLPTLVDLLGRDARRHAGRVAPQGRIETRAPQGRRPLPRPAMAPEAPPPLDTARSAGCSISRDVLERWGALGRCRTSAEKGWPPLSGEGPCSQLMLCAPTAGRGARRGAARPAVTSGVGLRAGVLPTVDLLGRDARTHAGRVAPQGRIETHVLRQWCCMRADLDTPAARATRSAWVARPPLPRSPPQHPPAAPVPPQGIPPRAAAP